jgi:hypothetical protein
LDNKFLNDIYTIINNEKNETDSNYSIWKKFVLSEDTELYFHAHKRRFSHPALVETESRTSSETVSTSSTGNDGGGSDESISPQPSRTAFDSAFEAAQRQLVNGHIVYSNITQMEFNRTYEFGARIAMNESLENLTKGFLSGPSGSQGLKVYKTMKVTLTGDEFEIEPRTDEIQPIPELVPGHNYGNWLWNVKPKQGGLHNLTLAAWAVIDAPPWPERSMFLETKRVDINVTVKKLLEKPITPFEWAMSQLSNIYVIIGSLIAFSISLFTLLEKLKQWKQGEKPKD